MPNGLGAPCVHSPPDSAAVAIATNKARLCRIDIAGGGTTAYAAGAAVAIAAYGSTKA